MFSVMYTGMNFFPLCTASVCPTISGITVERRDQVLMTFFSDPRFITSIFSSSGVSTNGPFLSERPIIESSMFDLVIVDFWLVDHQSTIDNHQIDNAYFCLRCTMNLSVVLRFRVL